MVKFDCLLSQNRKIFSTIVNKIFLFSFQIYGILILKRSVVCVKIKPKKILYKEWATKWLTYKKDYVKESTYANYSNVIYNHLIPDLGDTYLQDINHNLLQQYILDKLKKGRVGENSPLSEKTVKDIMMVLKSSLRYAMNQGVINVINLEFTYPKKQKNQKLYILSLNPRL